MRRVLIISLGLALATLALYWPVHEYQFVDYDDQAYVTDNAYVMRGLTWDGVRHAFTGRVLEYWQPLTQLSFMLDVQLFGANPIEIHLVNVALHIANVILLFLLLRRMTGAEWRSAMVAGLFAWHPLHVESVAWVAERKDVLSTFFWCLTILAYLRYVQHHKRSGYGLALVCFALGLLAKSMVVTLPCLLLLLDFWPLNRIAWPPLSVSTCHWNTVRAEWSRLDSPLRIWWNTAKKLALEKVPFFALTVLFSLVTFSTQKAGGSFISSDSLPLYLRAANAFVSYARYLGQTFWPRGLVAFYPHPGIWPLSKILGASLLFIGLTWFVCQKARTRPYLFVGWCWFVGLLVPTIGLVQAGWQSIADHFTYVPQTGVFLMLVWGAAEFTAGWKARRGVLMAGAVLVSAACFVSARLQMEHWRNSYELFAHAVASTRNNGIAEMGLGNALLKQGKVKEAIIHLKEAVRIYPYFTDGYNNLSGALIADGQYDEAEKALRKALGISPKDVTAHVLLGNFLASQGDLKGAAEQFQAALSLNPDQLPTLNNYANLLSRQGKIQDAEIYYKRALKIDPDSPETNYNLAGVLLRLGKTGEALGHYQKALQQRPWDPDANAAIGMVLAQQGKMAQALHHFEVWAQARPNDAQAQYRLSLALLSQGKTADAIGHLSKAISLKSNLPEPRFVLARIRATSPDPALRNADEAIKLAEEANDLTGGKHFFALDTLAAAYAEKGRFKDAVATAQKAADAARAAGQIKLANDIDERVQLYRAGKPFRETPEM